MRKLSAVVLIAAALGAGVTTAQTAPSAAPGPTVKAIQPGLVPCGSGMYPFPWVDVAGVGDAFCPGIMEAYVTGVSVGTSPSTLSPNDPGSRVQMTTFLQRSLDQALTRNTRRAAAEQWWLPQGVEDVQSVALSAFPVLCKPDRDSIWVAVENAVVRIEASTGKVLGTWTGANNAWGILVAAGKVFITGRQTPGVIYVIDPTMPPGAVTTLTTTGDAIGALPQGIAFDGAHIWTANASGSVSIITLHSTAPSPVSTVSAGFTAPEGVVFDGSHIWVTDLTANAVLQLGVSGNILQKIPVAAGPRFPVFDGTNVWVPSVFDVVTVIQASTGRIVATIAQDATNHLVGPVTAAFDGVRILVTNQVTESVTLFKASDLSLIGNIPLGVKPFGACSDGLNFWVTSSIALSIFRI